jgi:hypothetical protein
MLAKLLLLRPSQAARSTFFSGPTSAEARQSLRQQRGWHISTVRLQFGIRRIQRPHSKGAAHSVRRNQGSQRSAGPRTGVIIVVGESIDGDVCKEVVEILVDCHSPILQARS